MHPYSVLVRPLLSEKSNKARESLGKYAFEVHLKASKGEISKAIKRLYDVDVVSVRTIITRDRTRRRGIHVIAPGKVKKAIVTLKAGAKIPLFEDQ